MEYPIKIVSAEVYDKLICDASVKQVIHFSPKFIELKLDHILDESGQVICTKEDWEEFVNG